MNGIDVHAGGRGGGRGCGHGMGLSGQAPGSSAGMGREFRAELAKGAEKGVFLSSPRRYGKERSQDFFEQ